MLSVRGIARRYCNVGGGVLVRPTFLGGGSTPSLRARLVALARKEHSFTVSECVYGWTAAFQQTWSHVVIRIRLNPDAGISAQTMTNLQTTWQSGIVGTWSSRWGVGGGREFTCPLTFEVQWVTSNQHHTVRVRAGSNRSNMLTWDDQDTGAVASHEFGHMHGLVDEYSDSNCPSRSPVGTGTVMDTNSNTVPQRMMDRFAANLGNSVLALP